MKQVEYATHQIAVALAPVRQEPSERSEQTTQWHWNQKVIVIDQQKDWLLCRSQRDAYQGWVAEGQLTNAEDSTDSPTSQFVRSRWARIQTNTESIWVSHGCAPAQNTPIHEGEMGPPLSATPQSICETACLYLGTPYLWGGTSIWGIDCSGLIQQVFAVHGINLPRDAWQQAQTGQTHTDVKKSTAGDLAFFANEQNRITHVGLLLGEGQILHASHRVRIDWLKSDGIHRRVDRQKTHNLAHFCKVI